MVARSRSRSSYHTGTKVSSYDGETTTSRKLSLIEKCDDTHGQHNTNNPFILQRSVWTGGLLNGGGGGVLGIVYSDYPCDFVSAGAGMLPLNIPVLYAQGFRTAALARTGLSRPAVNLPLSIVELKDLPRAIKHAGDLLHKIKNPRSLNPITESASATLAWQFGWKPIIEDLKKLLDFQDIVEKRRRQINRAFDQQRGYSARSTLSSFNQSTTSKKPVQTSGQLSYSASVTVTSSERVWCSIWWTPRSHIRMKGVDAAKASAFKQALGLNKRNIPLTVWKALPWTWLTDWFVNVSDTIQAIDNQIDYRPNNGCIMVHRTSHTTFPGATLRFSSGHAVTVSGYSLKKESKLRYPVPAWGVPTPTMRLPFLDNFKLSVLGSLAILKIART